MPREEPELTMTITSARWIVLGARYWDDVVRVLRTSLCTELQWSATESVTESGFGALAFVAPLSGPSELAPAETKTEDGEAAMSVHQLRKAALHPSSNQEAWTVPRWRREIVRTLGLSSR